MESAIKKVDFARVFEISKGRVSQLLRLGVLREDENGRLPMRENITSFILYRNRPKPRRVSKISFTGELEFDLSGALREFTKGAKPRKEK